MNHIETFFFHRKILLLAFLLTVLFALSTNPLTYAQSRTPEVNAWNAHIEFNEAAFPTATTTLLNGAGTTTLFYDVVMPSGTSPQGNPIYVTGQDGINDIQLDVSVVDGNGGRWDKYNADYNTNSNGSFRSNYQISDNNSQPNDYAYVKYDFTFINGVESCNSALHFQTRHTSANGSTEAYEWTQIALNGTSINEGNIGNYQNTDYSDTSGATGSGAPFPNGITMSEFLTGATSGTNAPGGLIMPGWWAVDDFNTTILDGPEAATVNPGAGNGGPDDNQTLGGSANTGASDGHFGLADNTNISQVTYYFGLTDVAFDTDNDGFTRTNTLPNAGVTFFDLGCEEAPTAVSLQSFAAGQQNEAGLFTAGAALLGMMLMIGLLRIRYGRYN